MFKMGKPKIAVCFIIILFSLSSISIISDGACSPSEDNNKYPVIGILSHPRRNNG
ncbi:hypothetical protein SOVF_048110 [Spinacia oleracea]|nr:hypothetical protein SOVF_048110 [Spinacia oleracea]